MVSEPHLTRYASLDVTLLGDVRRPSGVTLAFTERTGGCSQPPYASLNLGDAVGDDASSVAANRQRVLDALGAGELMDRLVNPVQVHGTNVVLVSSGDATFVGEAQHEAREGADAVVCTVPDVPVLLCYADCVPLVMVAPGGFAVVHSGWKGTVGRIGAKALGVLLDRTGAAAQDVACYIGPHIGAADYEVSRELADTFAREFGSQVVCGERNLDLGRALRLTLEAEGVPAEAIVDECPSTASATDRFFSYRAEGGTCGRHGAVAVMRSCDTGGDA